jgi:hypothetical protein
MSILNEIHYVMRSNKFPNEIINPSLLKAHKEINIKKSIGIYFSEMEARLKKDISDKEQVLKDYKKSGDMNVLSDIPLVKIDLDINKKLFNELKELKKTIVSRTNDMTDEKLREE